MSMHLIGPELTTTSTKKRKIKVTKAQQEEIERGWKERNVRLKLIGLPKESLEEYTTWLYGRGKKTKDKSKTTISQSGKKDLPVQTKSICRDTGFSQEKIQSLNEWIKGPVSSKPMQIYTGTKVIGIGTMHKSNMVPIFNENEAEDISKMRRG